MSNTLRICGTLSAVFFSIAAQSSPPEAALTGKVTFEDSSPVEGAVVTGKKKGA